MTLARVLGFSGPIYCRRCNDMRAPASPISAGNTPGMMVVTPNRNQTLVFSGNGTQFADNALTMINKSNEAAAGQVTLPGTTESFVVSPDSSTAYVADSDCAGDRAVSGDRGGNLVK